MTDVASPRDPIFDCAGEMAERYASFDWSGTPLGAPALWPESLRTTVATVLRGRFPMCLEWGDSFVLIYNDAYIDILGAKHPALALPVSEVFPEIWDAVAEHHLAVLHGGGSQYQEDVPFVIERGVGLEEQYFTFSWSHVAPGPTDTSPGGILSLLSARTREVVGARRLAVLNLLTNRASGQVEPRAAVSGCLEVLSGGASDLVYGGFYAIDDLGDITAGDSFGVPPSRLPADGEAPQVVIDCARTAVTTIDAAGDGSDIPALVALPIRARDRVAGTLLLAPHPLRPLDLEHRQWLGLVAEQVGRMLSLATARSDEQARLSALAEIDAAKSDFLSNVSHEFRTPLTLLTGPLEDALATPSAGLSRAQMEVMHNSGRRLLRLVDALMDVARMDVEPREARIAPVDLTTLTHDLALPFELVATRAGLMLTTALDEIGVVASDPELWECIVINLVANAIKYTPAGLVEITLVLEEDEVVLRVSDSGVGIEASQHQRIFERFHRVLGPDAKTIEGTGLGLSLVADAARTLGGAVSVTSETASGSTFTVRVPLRHASPDELPITHSIEGATTLARDLASVLPPSAIGSATGDSESTTPKRDDSLPVILVVDDNAAMRDRVAHVLAPLGRVIACGDGVEALETISSRQIDLVVTDVAMPRLDGLALVERLRADERNAAVPVVVLSARAGAAAATSALELGADDYVVKPFASADLLARCRSTLALARLRVDRASASARDSVLAGVSHEMQTPLSVIMTALELLALPDTDAGTRAEAARRAAARVRILDRLVRQFLDWSRITTGSPIVALRAPTTLAELLTQVVADHPRAEVNDLGPHGPALVSCDVRRTEQILHTLLTHATRSPDSKVEVEVAEARDARGAVEGYDVLVRDDGPPIDEHALRALVTPVTLSDTPGTGAIGLAVSRAAARAQGGDLTVESTDQHGSIFVLRLASEA